MPFLGQACGDCQIQYGPQCVPCPEGSDLPECYGCIQGVKVKKEPWFDKKDIATAVVTGVITAIVVTYVTKKVVKI